MWKKYDDEFNRNALQKVFDRQLVRSVGEELGVNESLIHNWKRATLKNGDGKQTGVELTEIEALKKRSRELEQLVEILKKGESYLRARKLARYSFIAKERNNYPFRLLCRVMQISASGYYARQRKRLLKPPCVRRQSIKQLVRNCYFKNRRRYGSRRIAKSLSRSGTGIGRQKVSGLMREEGLKAIQRKAFKPKTTDSKETNAAPNVLTEIIWRNACLGKSSLAI